MKSKKLMLVLVSAVFVAVFVFSGAATSQKKQESRLTAEDAAETLDSRIVSKRCEVSYVLDNAGTIVTGWIDLGEVSWPNRRVKCKNLAIANCEKSKAKLLTYAPVGSANMQSICNQGKLCVYFDTRVENIKNTRDGSCCTPVACTRQPCPWTGYQ